MDTDPRFANQTEFFGPFAHIPGWLEACRMHTPSHGTFDCLIELTDGRMDVPPTVYVEAGNGLAFMSDRYPRSTTVPAKVQLSEAQGVVSIHVRSEGPIREATLTFEPTTHAIREEAYGGDWPTWGDAWRCEGVDLVRDGRCTGQLIRSTGDVQPIDHAALCTVGSMGRLTRA